MPIRWVVCPVVTVDGCRMPLVSTLLDPGRPGKTYKHSSCIDLADWALCFVRFVDASNLDSNSQVIHLFESDYEDVDGFLAQTPQQLGWNNARLNRIRNRMQAKGIETTGLTNTTPLWQWLARLGEAVRAGFEPRGTWVS